MLPVSHNIAIPKDLGLRHRAALGITEQSDALAVIVTKNAGMLQTEIVVFALAIAVGAAGWMLAKKLNVEAAADPAAASPEAAAAGAPSAAPAPGAPATAPESTPAE